ncbi:MAG TPA: hypothetical protein V6D50_22080 [Chroococcales cyanobacterium]
MNSRQHRLKIQVGTSRLSYKVLVENRRDRKTKFFVLPISLTRL